MIYLTRGRWGLFLRGSVLEGYPWALAWSQGLTLTFGPALFHLSQVPAPNFFPPSPSKSQSNSATKPTSSLAACLSWALISESQSQTHAASLQPRWNRGATTRMRFMRPEFKCQLYP